MAYIEDLVMVAASWVEDIAQQIHDGTEGNVLTWDECDWKTKREYCLEANRHIWAQVSKDIDRR